MIGTKGANRTLDALLANSTVRFRADFIMLKPQRIVVALAVTDRNLVIVPTTTTIASQAIVPLDKVVEVGWRKKPLSKSGTATVTTSTGTYEFQALMEETDALRMALHDGM